MSLWMNEGLEKRFVGSLILFLLGTLRSQENFESENFKTNFDLSFD